MTSDDQANAVRRTSDALEAKGRHLDKAVEHLNIAAAAVEAAKATPPHLDSADLAAAATAIRTVRDDLRELRNNLP